MANLRVCVFLFALLCGIFSLAAVSTPAWNSWEVVNLAADEAQETYQMGLSGWTVNAKVGFIEHTVKGNFADTNCENPYELDSHCESSNDETDFYSKHLCNMGVFVEKGSDEKLDKVLKDIRKINRNELLRGYQIAACKAAEGPRATTGTLAIVTVIFFVLLTIITGLYAKQLVYFNGIKYVIMMVMIAGSAMATYTCHTYTSYVSSVVYTAGIQQLGYSYILMWGSNCLAIIGFATMLFDDGLPPKQDEAEGFEDEESSEISETSEQADS